MSYDPEKHDAWQQDGIFYQIYTPSFMDSNGDGSGDFHGIQERLGYLSNLGVDGLILEPASSQAKDSPFFGSAEELQSLQENAQKNGIRIVTVSNPIKAAASQCKWNSSAIRRQISQWQEKQRDDDWPIIRLSSPESARAGTRYGLGKSDERLKAAAALCLLMRGTPVLYYGEEIGMRDIHLPAKLFSRNEQDSRAPMQWNNQKNAGFSSATPWLPINPDYEFRNVNAMIHDPHSLWTFYQSLIALRKHMISLRAGDLTLIDCKNESVLTFMRQYEKETTLVCLNLSQLTGTADLREAGEKITWKPRLSNQMDKISQIKNQKLKVEKEQIIILTGRR